jgi:CHAT domain-containing protein
VNILISHGRLLEAEQVVALLKDEEFSSLRRRDDPRSEVGYGSVEAEAVKALDRIGELGSEANELRDQKERKTLDEKGRQRLEQIERDLLPRANADFRRALASIEKEAPGTVVKTAEVKEAQSLMRYLRELGPGTVALYTVVSTEGGKSSKGWVILVTPNFQKAYEFDVADLDQTIAALRQTLRSDAYDPRPLAQKLYRMIFLKPQKQGKSLAEDLEAYLRDQKDKTLMWSLDGVLRYVSMAALHDGKQFLVERYRNVVFTPASLPGLTHTTSREWNALGLGVSKKYEGFKALSGVTKELSAIVRDGSKQTTGVLPGAIKWDDEFKERAMTDSLSEGYKVVHIASHFSYQAANPEKSFLLLGDGSHLEMGKLQDLTTLFEKTDLVTLSACDTAVGAATKDVNGKDAEGFAYVTQKLGAMAVIASLWPVDDIGTQVLMPQFYALHQSGLNKAEALRQAQLALLRGARMGPEQANATRSEPLDKTSAQTAKRFDKDPTRPYAHPYYWAPFILIGNWR